MSSKVSLRPTVERAPRVKILIPVGATMDIPTGDFQKGKYGQHILLAGQGLVTGVVGGPNLFKSTLAHYLTLTAMDRLMYAGVGGRLPETSKTDYDTEINMEETKLARFTRHLPTLSKIDMFEEGIWSITDKRYLTGTEFYSNLREFCKYKEENLKHIMVETPFLDRDGESLIKIPMPTFASIDSFTEFETDNILDAKDKGEIGDSSQNSLAARSSLAKSAMLSDLPRIVGPSLHFISMTAHFGEVVNMDAGRFAPIPKKQLPTLRNNEKIKGATNKFTYLTNNCWLTHSTSPLVNADGFPLYPRGPQETKTKTTDLQLLKISQLRGKHGPTGYMLEIVVSQDEGVLAGLTEFEYIKKNGRFGIGGNLQNYYLELYPDCKLSRTTIRTKINQDPKLVRALNLTSEIAQIEQFKWGLREYILEPKEIYERITKAGYDMDLILSRTRGWWCPNNDKQHLLELSSLDFLLMAHGLYHPYWLEDDKKTIKKEFDFPEILL